MASLTFLGTGPGNVMAGRFQSSLLLDCAGSTILLDAGEPCSGRLLELGFSLDELDAIWISHAHSDHTGGLPLLLQASKLHGRKAPLSLGLPKHLAGPFTQWLSAVLLPVERLGFPLEIIEWERGQARKLADLSVTPRVTTHVGSGWAQGDGPSPESFLFDVEYPGGRMVYSGDLGSASDLAQILDRPVDLLVCEMAHLTPEELIAVIGGSKVGTLCITHLASELDERREEIRMLLEEKLPGTDEVYLPDDGERIEF